MRLERPDRSTRDDESASGLSNSDDWSALVLIPVLLAGSVLKPLGLRSLVGIDLTVAAVAALLVVSAYQLSRRPAYPIRAMVPFVLFASVAFFAFARGDQTSYQVQKARDFFLVTSVVVACLPVVAGRAHQRRGLIAAWMISGAVAGCAVLLSGNDDSLYGRSGVGGSTLGPAYLASAGLVAAAAAWSELEVKWAMAVPVIVVAGTTIVSIGSRGPMLSAIVGVAAWIVMHGRPGVRMVRGALAFTMAILLGVSLASDRAVQRLLLWDDPIRLDLRREAVSAFLEHPLLGLGWGQFARRSSLDYPHNLIFEVAAEMGSLGLLVLGLLLATCARRAWPHRQDARVRILAAVGAVALVGQQFSSDLSNRVFWIALTPMLLFSARMSGLGTAGTKLASGQDDL